MEHFIDQSIPDKQRKEVGPKLISGAYEWSLIQINQAYVWSTGPNWPVSKFKDLL